MAAKESQKSKGGPGFGTDQPNNSTNLRFPHRTPRLGSVGVVPDRNSPESVRGGKN